MVCPACGGTGSVRIPYGGPYECPWCKGTGEMELEEVLKKDKPYRFSCCGKAVELPRQCTCASMSWCQDHGITHNGTHD